MRKNHGWAAFWQKKQYIIAGTLVILAAVGMTVLYSRGQEQERKQLEQEIAAEMDTENQDVAMEEETEADQVASILKPQTQSTETAEVEKESEEADSGQEEVAPTGNTSQALHFAAEDGILWPMEGNVILDYSMDSTVYFATLDQYKYNPAVIIAGDVNSKVYAVAKGKIQSIETNEVTGCTVTEDLGDGYLAVYGQLKEPEFAVGDYVEAGHVIGYVTEPTKYYSVEGSNLYFELRKDGVPVDPIEFLNSKNFLFLNTWYFWIIIKFSEILKTGRKVETAWEFMDQMTW